MSRIPKYEQSFAYHIEVELGLDINKIWNLRKNSKRNIKDIKFRCYNNI